MSPAAPDSGATDALLDLPFDQYSRHRIVQLVADSVRRHHGPDRLEVLDVGGFPCLTPRFLPDDRVWVVDVVDPRRTPPPQPSPARGEGEEDLQGTPAPQGGRDWGVGVGGSPDPNPQAPGLGPSPRYVQADGSALPFASDGFNLVVSLDSLEHVPRERREAYVSELLRVSRGYVLILAPFAAQETVLAERTLSEFVRLVNQEEQPQLREHREYGLPEQREWEAFLRAAGLSGLTFSSGYLYNWLPMMLVKHYLLSVSGSEELHRAVDRFYNQCLQGSDARMPGYRRGFVVSKLGSSRVLEEMSSALAPTGEADRLEVIERMEQIGLLLKLADLHVATRRDDRLRDQLLDKDRHILNLEQALREAQQGRGLAEARASALQGQLDAAKTFVRALMTGRLRTARAALAELRGGRSR